MLLTQGQFYEPISGNETEGSDQPISCRRKRGSASKRRDKTRRVCLHDLTERMLAAHARCLLVWCQQSQWQRSDLIHQWGFNHRWLRQWADLREFRIRASRFILSECSKSNDGAPFSSDITKFKHYCMLSPTNWWMGFTFVLSLRRLWVTHSWSEMDQHYGSHQHQR